MRIYIPNSAFLGNIETFLRQMDLTHPDHLQITFHDKWTAVHPLVLSMVAAVSNKCISCKIPVTTSRPSARSTNYLQRMGLFTAIGSNMESHIIEHESAGRFIPLTQIGSSAELANFITDVVPLLHATPNEVRPIQYVISELVRNVIEHSRSPQGAFVCAQYFRKTRRVSIGIADYGIGIKASLNTFHHPSDDITALKLALKPGITGTSAQYGGTPENAGAGLFFTKSIAKVGRNFFVLLSGNALYKLRKDPISSASVYLYADAFADNHTKSSNMPYWPGTAVGIDITVRTDTDFEGLLKLIHSAYRLNVKEDRKKKYKKARFE